MTRRGDSGLDPGAGRQGQTSSVAARGLATPSRAGGQDGIGGEASCRPATGERPLVAVRRCGSYDPEELGNAVRGALADLGGMAAFAVRGEKIGVKPNLLLGTSPDHAVTTHPGVVEAVAEELIGIGATPVLMESPGAALPKVARTVKWIYERTGIWEVIERLGLDVVLDNTGVSVPNPDGALVKRLDILAGALEVEGLVSLPKLKTHTFMTYTGAVKNLFGLIAGMAKGGYHAKLDDPLRFADMLLDVMLFARPRVSVMDAVLTLEGDGPGMGGSPRHVGAILASTDPVALDAVCCHLVGIDAALVPVLVRASARKFAGADFSRVMVVGDDVDDLRVNDFRLPAQRAGDRLGFTSVARFQKLLTPFVRGAVNPRPRPKEGLCIGCRTCERACPKSAITVRDGLAHVNDDLCIRCFCCHELCPVAAIDLEFVGLGRLARALRLV